MREYERDGKTYQIEVTPATLQDMVEVMAAGTEMYHISYGVADDFAIFVCRRGRVFQLEDAHSQTPRSPVFNSIGELVLYLAPYVEDDDA